MRRERGTNPIKGRAHPPVGRMTDARLTVRDHLGRARESLVTNCDNFRNG
jgi:hypothetical protein